MTLKYQSGRVSRLGVGIPGFTESGDLTLDVAGDITLDAGGGDIILKDDGTHWASLYTNGTHTYLQNMISDGDIYFKHVLFQLHCLDSHFHLPSFILYTQIC